MDRTTAVAIMATLTAGSMVALEYLRWSESRQKSEAVLAAAKITPEVSAAPSDKQDKREKEKEKEKQIDISPDRSSMKTRNNEDQYLLGARLVKSQYDQHCSCDEHAEHLYFNWPYSCHIQHKKDDVVVKAGSRPKLDGGFGNPPYESLSLAKCTMEYFSRTQKDMDKKQEKALDQWKSSWERTRALEMLAKDDVRGKETDFLTTWMVEQLNELFFFGAIKDLEVHWNTKELDKHDGLLGDAEVKPKDGHDRSTIRLHPTRRCYIKSEYVRQGKTLAEERIGCILHELLHIFVVQYMCDYCTRWENRLSHGRAWQRIAKAIEEQSLRLLGVEVDIGRLDAMLADRREWEDTRNSLHDLESWGFWKR